MDEILQRHKAISKLWNETQGYLKDSEHTTGFAFIPAINEMRYAARKLLDVWMAIHEAPAKGLSARKLKSLNEKLVIAEQYLVNAHHDITDEIIGGLSLAIDEWLEDWGPQVFQSVTAKKNELDEMILTAQSRVTESRRNREDRKSLYVELRENDVPMLIKEYNDLEKSIIENTANVLHLQETISNTNAQLDAMRFWRKVGIGLSVFGVLIALTRFL